MGLADLHARYRLLATRPGPLQKPYSVLLEATEKRDRVWVPALVEEALPGRATLTPSQPTNGWLGLLEMALGSGVGGGPGLCARCVGVEPIEGVLRVEPAPLSAHMAVHEDRADELRDLLEPLVLTASPASPVKPLSPDSPLPNCLYVAVITLTADGNIVLSRNAGKAGYTLFGLLDWPSALHAPDAPALALLSGEGLGRPDPDLYDAWPIAVYRSLPRLAAPVLLVLALYKGTARELVAGTESNAEPLTIPLGGSPEGLDEALRLAAARIAEPLLSGRGVRVDGGYLRWGDVDVELLSGLAVVYMLAP